MQRMSDSTKLLLGGAAMALAGYFLPFFKDQYIKVSLSTLSQWDNSLYLSLGGLIMMVVLCFMPSIYNQNARMFVTYQLIAWLANLLFVAFFYINNFTGVPDLSGGFYTGLYGMGWYGDALKPQMDIGAMLYIAGNVLFAFGLFQIWNNVGGGYAPNVYDAGAEYPNYPDTVPVDDYPPSHAHDAPSANYPPPQPAPRYAPPKPQKPKTQAWLVDDYSGKTFQLVRGTTSIGRNADNDVRFSDSKVSNHHAKILEEKGHFRIVDLASTNGTYVNGKKIHQAVLLYPDDSIRFGDRLKVRFVGIKR